MMTMGKKQTFWDVVFKVLLNMAACTFIRRPLLLPPNNPKEDKQKNSG